MELSVTRYRLVYKAFHNQTQDRPLILSVAWKAQRATKFCLPLSLPLPLSPGGSNDGG